MKKSFTKIISILIISTLCMMLVPFASSCRIPTEFGDIIICTDIDPETAEPVESAEEFSFDVQKLYVVINASGVDVDDIKGFTIKRQDTGETVLDKSDKYSSDLEGKIEGNFYLKVTIAEGKQFMFEPGGYTAEFYHNGDLVDSKDFTILKPEVEIMEVVLANQVDDQSQAPVSITDNFSDTDVFYAVLKLNHALIGEYFEAKWYYQDDELLYTTDITLDQAFYGENYVSLSLTFDQPWPEGEYNVEIYQNGNFYGNYPFTVAAQPESEEAVYFSDGNVYTNQDFNFACAYPNGWAFQDGETTDGGFTVEFIAPGDMFLSFNFITDAQGSTLEQENYEAFADDYISIFGDEWTLTEKTSESYVNGNGLPFIQYNYYLLDDGGNEWNIILDFFEENDQTFVMISLAMEENYEVGSLLYVGILNSFNVIN